MPAPSQHSHDPYELLWMLALLLAVCLLMWHFFGDGVTWFLLLIKKAQLWVLTLLWPHDEYINNLANAVNQSLYYYQDVSVDALLYSLDSVGQYWRWPVIVGLLVIAAWFIVWHPDEGFTKRYTLHELAEAMGGNWPFALHALRRGQINIPLDDPQWGMAQTEWRFVHHNQLWTDQNRLDTTKTEQVLTQQLGGRWTDIADIVDLPLHAQALAGIFLLRAASYLETDLKKSKRQKDEAFEHLKYLAAAAAKHKKNGYLPLESDYQAVIKKTQPYLTSTELLSDTQCHAYNHTALMRLLENARQNGLLQPALFNWLKGVDRPLWYALTTLGRRVPFPESLGSFSHYHAERQLNRALLQPVVGNAVTGLESALERSENPYPSDK